MNGVPPQMDLKPDYPTTKERKPTTNHELESYLHDVTRCSTLQPHGFESNPYTY